MIRANWQQHFRALELLVILLAIARLVQGFASWGWQTEGPVAIVAIGCAASLLYFTMSTTEISTALRVALVIVWLVCVTWYGWFSVDSPLRAHAEPLLAFDIQSQPTVDWTSALGGVIVYVILVAASAERFFRIRIGSTQQPHERSSQRSTTIWLLAISAVLFASIGVWEFVARTPGNTGKVAVVLTLLLALHLSSLAAEEGSRLGLGMALGEAILTPLLSMFRA